MTNAERSRFMTLAAQLDQMAERAVADADNWADGQDEATRWADIHYSHGASDAYRRATGELRTAIYDSLAETGS